MIHHPERKSHIRDKYKVVLDLPNHAKKLEHATDL